MSSASYHVVGVSYGLEWVELALFLAVTFYNEAVLPKKALIMGTLNLPEEVGARDSVSLRYNKAMLRANQYFVKSSPSGAAFARCRNLTTCLV